MGGSSAPDAGGPVSQAVSVLRVAHRRRLRELWRSAGWPSRDAVELDLLTGGMLSRHWDAQGCETLRVTEAGLQWLAAARRRHQEALGAHEALVARVAREMQRAGRLVWRGLSLRAPLQTPTLPVISGPPLVSLADPLAGSPATAAVQTTWAVARPDVFSIRHTTVEDYTEPVVHEIKVSRADLLSDLRLPHKGAAYRAVASQCWYVLRQGIAEPDELPEAYGVIFASDSGLVVARPAPRRAVRVPFAVWMLLARAVPEADDEDPEQPLLGAQDGGHSPAGSRQ